MKKILACIMALALVLSITPMAFAVPEVGNPGITATAVRDGNKITLTVTVPPVTGLSTCVVSVGFNPGVVSIEDLPNYAVLVEFEGEMIPRFSGIHEGGIPEGYNDIVKNAFTTTSGINKVNATDFAEFVFTIEDDTAESAVFYVYLEQYEDNTTKVEEEDDVLIDVLTVTINEGTEPSESESETDPPVEDCRTIAQKILDLLTQFDPSEEDAFQTLLAELMALLGDEFADKDFSEILESIIGGNIGGSDLTGILNQMLNFITGLFGGGSSTTTTTAKATTTTTGADDDTAASGSDTDTDKKPGDAGIALTAAVCLAAAAAFVIIKKKKD